MDNARIAGLSRAATRTEILRAREAAALTARVGTNETDIATNVSDITALETLTTPSAWTGVSYLNSWADFGGTYQGVEYRKVGDIVYLRGVMAGGTASADNFQLPSGFRPAKRLRFPLAGTTAPTVGVGTLNTDGTFNARMAATTFISVDGVFFSTTA